MNFCILIFKQLISEVTSTARKFKRSEEVGAASATFEKLDSEALRALPETVDWRTKGIVTPVKTQGPHCLSSDWAFSTVSIDVGHS